jgi:hypothetical protein
MILIGSSEFLRYVLELLRRIPIGWCLLRLVPLCTASKPRVAKRLRADWRRILVTKLDAATRAVFVERSAAIEAPRGILEAQAADPAAIYIATAH